MIFPNKKRYFGITKNFKARQNKHKNRAKKKQYQHLKLYRAINKYGFKNIIWDIYKSYTTWSGAQKGEIKCIAKYNTTDINFGYNTTSGGEGHLGYSPSSKTRQKISLANKGKIRSKKQKEILSKSRLGSGNPMFGKHSSDKQKSAVSQSSSGEKNANAKLTNKLAKEIRNKYVSGKYLIQDLAEEYKVNRNNISKILKNKSYKDPHYKFVDLQGNNKFTTQQAKKIKQLYATNNYTQKQLAEMFKVHWSTIFRILNSSTYIP